LKIHGDELVANIQASLGDKPYNSDSRSYTRYRDDDAQYYTYRGFDSIHEAEDVALAMQFDRRTQPDGPATLSLGSAAISYGCFSTTQRAQ
jgi:hypothetical protein